jgi:hypothetical protein
MTATQFPVYLAGMRLTAALLSSGIPNVARKNSSETAPASAASVQDDNELFVSVAANASYLVDGWIIYTATTNVPDLRTNWSYPSGASFSRTEWGAPTGSTTGADTIDTTIATTGDVSRGADANPRSLYVKGDLIVGANAGTFTFRFGQVTSSAATVTVVAGSRIVLTRYA